VQQLRWTSHSVLVAGVVFAGVVTIFGTLSESAAQGPPPQTEAPLARPNPYARSAVDPAVAAQGKGSFSVRCAFCHGSDARGGESGPNLLRSEIVLTDQNGEKIGPVVLHGRPQQGMPSFDLSGEQIVQLAAFLHSIPVSGNERGRNAPIKIPVGDAEAGRRDFEQKCASCHSPTGNLKGISEKITDARALQQSWLMPGMRGGAPSVVAPPKQVNVSTSGAKVSGRLLRIDDFIVSLQTESGQIRTFERTGDLPKVEVVDPLDGHIRLLPTYTDKSIHDITAYLVTIK
jgi:cytochrome c oxidase cbb3-type subunit 3